MAAAKARSRGSSINPAYGVHVSMAIDWLLCETIFLRQGAGLGTTRRKTRMPGLFDSLELGSIELPNRIVMAPLTRARAGFEGVPNALMAAYYSQRASAGLIISEATG